MGRSKTLRRPANWQDFEDLCKKLWGEIWNYPEIQKNGRLGQDQSGVDIFGIPSGEELYYGIQCKGKSEYNDSHKQFTEKEILNEIEKAKQFQPTLKKFYLATTALNDAKLQAFIRQQNIKHIGLGLFEIHLFCWESIVDLIDDNRRTHNWYVKNQDYQNNKSVAITFHDDSAKLKTIVPFEQTITEFREELPTANITDMILKQNKMFKKFSLLATPLNSPKVNNSYFKFNLRIHNTGIDPIEEFKILLSFEGEFQDLETMTKGGGDLIMSIRNYSYNTFIDKVKKTGKIIPSKRILVGDDVIDFDTIIIKPLHELETDLLINWKVISKDFKDEGKLKLIMLPEIKTNQITELVNSPEKCRIIIGDIEDYITDRGKNIDI